MMIDDTLLMKYMQGLCSDKEKDAISRWLEQSEENRKAFRDAHFIYESLLMSTDPAAFNIPVKKNRGSGHSNLLRNIAAVAAVAAPANSELPTRRLLEVLDRRKLGIDRPPRVPSSPQARQRGHCIVLFVELHKHVAHKVVAKVVRDQKVR